MSIWDVVDILVLSAGAGGKARLSVWEKLVTSAKDEVEQDTRCTRRRRGVVDGAQEREMRTTMADQWCALRCISKK